MKIVEKYAELHAECKKNDKIQLTVRGRWPYAINEKKEIEYILENFAEGGFVEKFCISENLQRKLKEARMRNASNKA